MRSHTIAACAVGLLLAMAATAQADKSRAMTCLTPEAGDVLARLVAARELDQVQQAGFTLEKVDIRTQEIELGVRSRAGDTYSIVLSTSGSPAVVGRGGSGSRFTFAMKPGGGANRAEAERVLLAAAALINRAIPETALVDCSGRRVGRPQSQDPVGVVPGSIAMATAALEWIVVAAAILFGLRAVRTSAR